MNRYCNQKSASLLRWAAAITVVGGLVGCGGGSDGGSATSPDSGSNLPGDSAGQQRDEVPAAARQSGKSFVAWLRGMVAGSDESSEPIGVGMQAIPADDSSEPMEL